jgi:PAS domain S-box-containing protein
MSRWNSVHNRILAITALVAAALWLAGSAGPLLRAGLMLACAIAGIWLSQWASDLKRAQIADIAERRQAEAALRASEQRYRSIVTNMGEAMVLDELIYNKEGVAVDWLIHEVNPAYERLVGKSREEAVGKRASALYAPETLPVYLAPYAQVAAAGTPARVELYDPLLEKHFLSSIFPVGERQIAVMSIDITDLKRAEQQLKDSLQEKTILLQEIHHRVKNNLAVVSSLLAWQADAMDDETVRRAFSESQNRIRAMARAHEHLYRSRDVARVDMAKYIAGLVNHLQQSYAVSSVQPRLELEQVRLDPDRAIPCGLVVSELLSNAFKYAFPRSATRRMGDPMRIVVALRAQDQRILLKVSDNGVGLPVDVDVEQPATVGLGLVRVLVDQLGGKCQVDRNEGTTFRITFSQP